MSVAIQLGVNIDHVATLRQARRARYPDPVHAALAAELAGADSITVHLREDRRHIVDADVRALRPQLQTRMNLECALTQEMLDIACEVRPHDVCLVPEKRAELTTEGGLDVAGQFEAVRAACRQLADAGSRVSLFIDADETQIVEALHKLRAAKLLTGFRGAPPVDVKAVADAVLAIARLMRTTPGIVEIDVNPLMVHAKGHGARALDALVVAE